MGRRKIELVEKNIRGAWVIWGQIGIRQYYYHTKREAMRKYREECDQTILTSER